MNIYAEFTKDSEFGYERYQLHRGFTQPLPFYKRTKVKKDEDQHKFAVYRRVQTNPILYRVTGGDILKVVIDRMEKQFSVKVKPDQVLFVGGFGNGMGWLVDFEDKHVKEGMDIIILENADLHKVVTDRLKTCFEDISRIGEECKPWSGSDTEVEGVWVSWIMSSLPLPNFPMPYASKRKLVGLPLNSIGERNGQSYTSITTSKRKGISLPGYPDLFGKNCPPASPVYAVHSLCLLGTVIKWDEEDQYSTISASFANRLRDRMNNKVSVHKRHDFDLLNGLRYVSTKTMKKVLQQHARGEK